MNQAPLKKSEIHEENRGKICLFCLFKNNIDGRVPNLNKMGSRIQKHKVEKKDSGLKTQLMCGRCYVEIDKDDISHKCSGVVQNVKIITESIPSKQKEQLLSALLKEKANEVSDVNKKESLGLSQRHGRPLKVHIGAKKSEIQQPLLTLNDMTKIHAGFNNSQRTTLGFASIIRTATRKRKIIEPNLKEHLQTKSHSVDQFFAVRKFDFMIKREANCCTNVKGFIEYVKQERQVSFSHLNLGIDGGGGFLKVCLTVQTVQNESDSAPNNYSTRRKYNDGLPTKRFRESGVKKLLILAIVPSTPENYHNVAHLWYALDLNEIERTVAVDLKLANILSGIMSHSSLYPCTWCFASKYELQEIGEYRTTGLILKNYNDYKNAGEIKKNAKNFMNCTNPPIFNNNTDQLLLDVIPPPELHLMLGVVNHVYNVMREKFVEEISAWSVHCNVEREIKRGSSGFNGNSCRTLLNNLDHLRSICSLPCLSYVKVLNFFQLVVKSCFGQTLDPNFINYIDNFKQSYVAISITPKAHAVFYHVKHFCMKNQQALGFHSEQAMEAVHFDFLKAWSKYEVKPNHSNYIQKLLQAVGDFNGFHI